jgi:hypothetical protein
VEHWRTPYLGLRDMPPGLDDFELATFFSYSAHELERISARQQPLHRLTLALHIGFLKMTGRKLDAIRAAIRVCEGMWHLQTCPMAVSKSRVSRLILDGQPVQVLRQRREIERFCLRISNSRH